MKKTLLYSIFIFLSFLQYIQVRGKMKDACILRFNEYPNYKVARTLHVYHNDNSLQYEITMYICLVIKAY